MTTIALDNIDWYYINLSHREDRRKHIAQQLSKAGITAKHFPAHRKEEYTGPPEDVALMQPTPNTIGNWLSHTAIISKATNPNRIVGLLEDDALLCSDFCQRIERLTYCFNKPWDIFFLGGTCHNDRGVWHPKLGRDMELTDTRHVIRVYGAFSNQGYLINGGSGPKIAAMMQERMSQSRGSDHALIQIQPLLNCYCFIPGMVFQIDGKSDIGEGITHFSNFLKSMGSYVWTDTLDEFDYDAWEQVMKGRA